MTLPDNVMTQVRFKKDARTPTGFRAEWRVANRSFAMPDAHTLEECVPRVTNYFASSHKVLVPVFNFHGNIGVIQFVSICDRKAQV